MSANNTPLLTDSQATIHTKATTTDNQTLEQTVTLVGSSGFQITPIEPKEKVGKVKHYSIPMALYVGDRRMDKYTKEIRGYPLLDVVMQMNAVEKWFFTLLRAKRDYTTCISDIPGKELTKTELNKLSLAYKSLYKKDLVKRVSPGRYMINPDALISLDYYDVNKAKWDQLK